MQLLTFAPTPQTRRKVGARPTFLLLVAIVFMQYITQADKAQGNLATGLTPSGVVEYTTTDNASSTGVGGRDVAVVVDEDLKERARRYGSD
jgi:hypothetical protein